ncbi:MAG: hypothetical protein GX089_10280 [Fibrobacter sp.]|nr:hypothetical protein [Fibrobacter sp.]
MMYDNGNSMRLLNIETGEVIRIVSSHSYHFGGLSPDGKYAFYSESDKRIENGIINGNTYIYSVTKRTVEYRVYCT